MYLHLEREAWCNHTKKTLFATKQPGTLLVARYLIRWFCLRMDRDKFIEPNPEKLDEGYKRKILVELKLREDEAL